MGRRKLLLTKEAADTLRISEAYLRALIKKRKIIAYKEGRRGGYRIPFGEIDRYIAKRYKKEDVLQD